MNLNFKLIGLQGTAIKQNSSLSKNPARTGSLHSMEDTTTLEAVADRNVQESKVPSSTSTQQLEVEGEEKTKKEESKIDVQEVVEKCINKGEKSKHGREEIDDKEKEKDYKKVSKRLFVPFVIAAAGSALLVTLVVMFVRHKKSRKR